MEPWNTNFELYFAYNFILPTKYVIPKSLKFSHWPSKSFYHPIFWCIPILFFGFLGFLGFLGLRFSCLLCCFGFSFLDILNQKKTRTLRKVSNKVNHMQVNFMTQVIHHFGHLIFGYVQFNRGAPSAIRWTSIHTDGGSSLRNAPDKTGLRYVTSSRVLRW